MGKEEALEKKLFVNMKLKTVSRVMLNRVLMCMLPETPYHIRFFVALMHKAIDLFDSILQLQKIDHMESAQALVRCIFETNLKFGHFIRITDQYGDEYVTKLVTDSIMIVKFRDAKEQGVLGKKNKSFQTHAENISRQYSKEDLEKIKKHGFCMTSIIDLAKADDKMMWYNCMYRNFSRNVHSHDMTEYLRKQGIFSEESEDNSFDRDIVALDCAFLFLWQILCYVNKFFDLGGTEQLDELRAESNAV